MNDTMLVRTGDGGWETLRPHTATTEGGLVELFGEDIGPVLGTTAPLIVVASEPTLPSGQPDALCVDPDGQVTVVTMSLGQARDDTLAALLAHAGALNGIGFDQFQSLCNRTSDAGSLAEFVAQHGAASDFHRGTFEVTVADALAHGRFQLVALVGSAPSTLVQSICYLNSSGANVALYQTQAYTSPSVMAVQANMIDVGYTAPVPSVTEMTPAGLLALTERSCDEQTATLMAQLQRFCTEKFDNVIYEGDTKQASFTALINHPDGPAKIISATHTGAIAIHFEELTPFDSTWRIRLELSEAISRLLGADIGEVNQISQLNLNIREHLMDATLMEALIEVLSDTLFDVRDTEESRTLSAA